MSTVYILGAGASHEGGVALGRHILPAAYSLWQQGAFDAAEQERVAALFAFIGDVYHGGQLDINALPDLDGLWGIVEIGARERARFGRFAGRWNPSIVRDALTSMMVHILVGSRVEYDQDGVSLYTLNPLDNPYRNFVPCLKPDDTIIALNYDTLLDRALHEAGVVTHLGSDFRREQPAPAIPSLRLLKIHGSFNWLYCPTCDNIWEFAMDDVAGYALRADAQHVHCPIDGTPRETIIIPPSLVKTYSNRHLDNIWSAAAETIRTAKRMVAIGYALADADIQVRYMMVQAASLNPALSQPGHIEVVNISQRVLDGYRAYFGPTAVNALQMRFREWLVREPARPVSPPA